MKLPDDSIISVSIHCTRLQSLYLGRSDKITDALSRLCENHMLSNESEKPVFTQIAAVHNSIVGHWGLQKCREFLNDPTITDRTITQFIRQCPCCQVMCRQKLLIKTHPFTCASYNPFESLHIDHIGPLPVDDKSNSHILVMIDVFSEAAGCIFQHFGRFGTLDVIHTDQGPAFRNELFSGLSRLSQVEHSFATAYSKEENGLVERANQEVMLHLRAILFDARVHDKWSYEQLPMVQRIHWESWRHMMC